mmetsp:Transcript_21284/g.63944  ORF Transcript_21284/g.63944 Transcript_21284/m.63944 type:complete len:278 (-) Transcript_21284:6-839(-)
MMALALRMSGSRSRSASSCTMASRRSRRSPPKSPASASGSGADCIFSRASRMMVSAFSLSPPPAPCFLDFPPAGPASSLSSAAATSALSLGAFLFGVFLPAASAFGFGAPSSSSSSPVSLAGLALAALPFLGLGFSAGGSFTELSGSRMPWAAQLPPDSRVLRASSRDSGPASGSATSLSSGCARPATGPCASMPWRYLGVRALGWSTSPGFLSDQAPNPRRSTAPPTAQRCAWLRSWGLTFSSMSFCCMARGGLGLRACVQHSQGGEREAVKAPGT